MKIHIKVIANSSKNSIEKISDAEFKIHLKEKAVKGKANKALIELLAEYFRKKRSEITIEKGLTSNNKTISVI